MSAISKSPKKAGKGLRNRAPSVKSSGIKQPVVEISRAEDARVVRSRAAALEAARTLFLKKGYAGTTMEDIAELAGLTKRTLYNNYADKDTLFLAMVASVITYAALFARGLHKEFTVGVTAANLRNSLNSLAQRLALGIVRPEVIALRRLLIGEARTAFPDLARQYFDRAPGQVIDALASGFELLAQSGVLQLTNARRTDTRLPGVQRSDARLPDARRPKARRTDLRRPETQRANARVAAAQFAYLIVGEPLDRAMLVGTIPTRAHIIACAEEGVETFLMRYAPVA